MGTSPSSGFPSIPALLAQIGAAIVGGLIVGAVGYFIPWLLLAGAGLGMGLLSIQVFAVVIGFGAGAGLGVALIGRVMGQPGNLWLAVVAGAVSGIVVILVMRLLNIGGLGGILGLGLPLVLIAAMAAYNWRR